MDDDEKAMNALLDVMTKQIRAALPDGTGYALHLATTDGQLWFMTNLSRESMRAIWASSLEKEAECAGRDEKN